MPGIPGATKACREMVMAEHGERRDFGRFVPGALVVVIGAVLLTNSLGYVDGSFWGNLWQLWLLSVVAGAVLSATGTELAGPRFHFGTFGPRVVGSGDIRLEGRVDVHELSILGSGESDAWDLASGHVGAHIAGSGTARVDAQNSRDIVIPGSGDLEYSGQPRIDQTVIGSGSVRHAR